MILPSFSQFLSIAPPFLIFFGGILFAIFLFMYMRPRRFYLVRHGQTLLNAQHVRQGSDGDLSEKGRRQADHLGQYLKRFAIDTIISSTYPRARQTAEAVQKYVNARIIYSPLFVERRNPTNIIGKHTDDPDVVHIVDQMDLAYHEDDYRVSDEENFIDERTRARKAVSFLSHLNTRGTIIVTHHHFLKMLISYMLYRENLHAADYIKLAFFNVADNAGITICEFHPWQIFSATRGWEVVSYNEQPE